MDNLFPVSDWLAAKMRVLTAPVLPGKDLCHVLAQCKEYGCLDSLRALPALPAFPAVRQISQKALQPCRRGTLNETKGCASCQGHCGSPEVEQFRAPGVISEVKVKVKVMTRDCHNLLQSPGA